MGKKAFALWVIYGIAVSGIIISTLLLLETTRGLSGSLAEPGNLDALVFPMFIFIIALSVKIFAMVEILTDKKR